MSEKVHAVAGDGASWLSDMSLFRQQAYVDGATAALRTELADEHGPITWTYDRGTDEVE